MFRPPRILRCEPESIYIGNKNMRTIAQRSEKCDRIIRVAK